MTDIIRPASVQAPVPAPKGTGIGAASTTKSAPCTCAAMAPLPHGSRIALVSPASPPPSESIDAAVLMLRQWGFDVVEGEHLRDVNRHLPYLAGEDDDRALDVQRALCDDGIDAVMCARGGYGSARILPFLDAQAIREARPKPFFGSSDITALHAWLFETCGRPGWFAPMPATTAVLDDAVARDGLRRAMDRGLPPHGIRLVSTDAQGSDHHAHGVRGVIRGGNLSLLAQGCAGQGRHGFDEPTIALIEEVHEPAYHIDGLLQELLRGGWFRNVRAIALGSWLDCEDTETIANIVEDNLHGLGIPIAYGFDFGHGPQASTVPLGVRGRLDIDDGGATLECGASPTNKERKDID